MRALRGIELMAIVTAPASAGHDVVSRVFVPAWGVDEDPVTGSAHAALAPSGPSGSAATASPHSRPARAAGASRCASPASARSSGVVA
jgi:hypothetical protein